MNCALTGMLLIFFFVIVVIRTGQLCLHPDLITGSVGAGRVLLLL